ncbi:MAG: transposase [Clostridiaceae bacterium]|nr:transposase [Clostridiaceae bacterium]
MFYEAYPGSIVDVSQLQFMLEKAKGYGYKKVGFILDRGYFSKKNIQYMDSCQYDFVIMVKGMASFVEKIILKNKGSFEKKSACFIPEYQVYGVTLQDKLYVDDEKDRYFHIYHKVTKESAERGILLDLCGYFVIVTSRKMTAAEALSLYKSRDVSEKLFRGDKSYLGNTSLRVSGNESATAKIFIEFVALIVRCKLYTQLKAMMAEMSEEPNDMTVPAALKELEKIEMIRQLDNVYRLDHEITATQKTILKAFGVDENYIKAEAMTLSEQLKLATIPEWDEEVGAYEEDDIDC